MKLFGRIVLVAAGLILLLVGGGLLFFPVEFLESNGVGIKSEPSLLSEIRAPGGLLIASAVVILAGAAIKSLTRPALILASMVYCSYGISRLISMAVDGLPSSSLINATVWELAIGAVCVFALLIDRPRKEA